MMKDENCQYSSPPFIILFINSILHQQGQNMSNPKLKADPNPQSRAQPGTQTPTRYQTKDKHPILQSYKRVSNKLEQEHFRVKSNNSKIHDLQKKLSCLELLNKSSQKQSMTYQRKLQKLENTQKYATELLKMKYKSFMEVEQDSHHRYNQCITQKAKMIRNRKISQSLHQQNKTAKLRLIRQDNQRVKEQRQKNALEHERRILMYKEEVREQEEQAKDRRRRYQQFKMQRAALNYTQKLEQEYENYKEKTRYLSELQQKASKAEQIFRKTQRLNKETQKIQSIYLTDT